MAMGLMDLFKEKDPENLPAFFLAMSLPETTLEERLHLYVKSCPSADFGGHPNQGQSFVPVAEWTLSDWQQAQVHLLPELRTPELKEELMKSITQLNPFEISQQLLLPANGSVTVSLRLASYRCGSLSPWGHWWSVGRN